jgi:multidrug efflux system membrane fusion protein
VDSSVDTATGTILAKATFANQDFSLWPGMYVDVEVDLDTRPDTISIPTVALQTSQKGPFVFVVKPDATAEMRVVETGGIVEDRTAIREGLKPGERVVIEGQLRLADGARVKDVSRDAANSPPRQRTSQPPEGAAARQDAAR